MPVELIKPDYFFTPPKPRRPSINFEEEAVRVKLSPDLTQEKLLDLKNKINNAAIIYDEAIRNVFLEFIDKKIAAVTESKEGFTLEDFKKDFAVFQKTLKAEEIQEITQCGYSEKLIQQFISINEEKQRGR